jgi:hypothetical protein
MSTATSPDLWRADPAYAPGASESQPRSPRGSADQLLAAATRVWPTLLTAAVLCLVTFLAGGGVNSDSTTIVPMEMGLTLAGGLAVALAVALTPARRRAYGLWSVGLLLVFAALSALSVVWSVQPDYSWQDASRLLAYSGVFGAAIVLARSAPARWSAVLGGVILAAVVVCGYALLSKVFPGQIGAEQPLARLQEPYGYWNALGLTADLGAIACLWLGARRSGHALLSALAYPAIGLMLVTLMLAYSRGALAALVLGLALWLCLVPLRLRGARVLLVGGVGAGLAVAWDFSRSALTTDHLPLATRSTAGHQLGVVLAAMLVLLAAAGLAIGFLGDRRPGGEDRAVARRRAGAVLLALPVLAVLALAGALTASHRGLFGSISHAVSTLTNPNAPVPSNGPGRLTAIASVRARYWKEALQIFDAHPLLGSGAASYEIARLHYRTEALNVKQAHGFVVQTLADLGLVGLLVVLALLAAWLVAAGRATHPFNRRWSGWRWRRQTGVERRYSPERIGLLSMVCVVVTFGVHSFVDWTWYVPGDACVALLCAGWVAGRNGDSGRRPVSPGCGRGPLGESAATRTGPRRGLRLPALRELDPLRCGAAAAVLIAALLAAWAEWQPLRSSEASSEALALFEHDKEALAHGAPAGSSATGNPAAGSAATGVSAAGSPATGSSPATLTQLAHRPGGALAMAQAGVSRDPVSASALLTLAAIQQGSGEAGAARATLERAVHLQPSNPQTWQALGEYELQTGSPRAALSALRAAVYLNPEAVAPRAQIATNEELLTIQDAYLEALRAVAQTESARSATGASRATGASGRRAQKRARRAATSSTRRAPGTPPTPRISTSSKPNSSSSSPSTPRV